MEPSAEQIQSSDFRMRSYPLPLPEDLNEATATIRMGSQPSKQHYMSWPVLYVLTNAGNDTVYIGETTNYVRRMDQHHKNPQKDFDQTLLIDSPTFNQSATFDFENRLIELFLADGRFHVTNRNNGYCQFNYYQREQYRQKFRKLWGRLAAAGYTRRRIEELENTDLFKYSPYKSLTPDQYEVIEKILDDLQANKEGRSFTVVSGAPGTGKSILAITLLLKLKTLKELEGPKVALVCPVQSLRDTLKKLARCVDGLKGGDIISPSEAAKGPKYDVLLVDEAHRLTDESGTQGKPAYRKTCDRLGLPHSADQLDWLLSVSKKVYVFFDERQLVKATGLNKDRLDEKIQELQAQGVAVDSMRLSSQMRVRGGDEYLDFVFDLLNGSTEKLGNDLFGRVLTPLPEVASKTSEARYQFAIVDSYADFCELQRAKEEECGLSRMVAGYAWEWASKNDSEKFDITIEGIGRKWNTVSQNWVNSPTAAEEVGCVHTTQGYDLNYGFVIIGDDLRFDANTGAPQVQRRNFKDRGAKLTSTDESLRSVVINAYYVLMTRGMFGTFLYVTNPETKKYLSRFVPVICRDENGQFSVKQS